MNKKIVVFDLDDTLYNELDFLKSAYNEIAIKVSKELNISPSSFIYEEMLNNFVNKENPFKKLVDKYSISNSLVELVSIYRSHKPILKLSKDKQEVLTTLKERGIPLCILTDGRSLQQRNKLNALGITRCFSEIIVSEEFGTEKPNINNFKYFENIFGIGQYYYIGDNIVKDFVTPNKMNWSTICLKDSGLNIHSQNIKIPDKQYQPNYLINSFYEILDIVL